VVLILAVVLIPEPGEQYYAEFVRANEAASEQDEVPDRSFLEVSAREP
jgi:hypothetical protein